MAITNDKSQALVFVPASFSLASLYADVVSGMRSAGYESHISDLPTITQYPATPAPTMADDAAHFRSIAASLANEGKDVIFVAHSYGGVVAAEACKGILKSERQKEGKKGGVTAIVCTACVAPDEGMSTYDANGGEDKMPDWLHVEGEYLRVDHEPMAKFTFSDMPLEQALEIAKKTPLESRGCYGGKLTFAGYQKVPVTWILPEADEIIPPEVQKMLIENLEQKSGNKVKVLTMEGSGHFPQVTQPSKYIAKLREALGEPRS